MSNLKRSNFRLFFFSSRIPSLPFTSVNRFSNEVSQNMFQRLKYLKRVFSRALNDFEAAMTTTLTLLLTCHFTCGSESSQNSSGSQPFFSDVPVLVYFYFLGFQYCKSGDKFMLAILCNNRSIFLLLRNTKLLLGFGSWLRMVP